MCVYIYCITLFYIIVYVYSKNGDALCFFNSYQPWQASKRISSWASPAASTNFQP